MLIVQTADGLSNANSYASTADLMAFALERGITLVSDNLESLLIKATDYIDSKQYKGEPFNNTQSTKFPIKGVGVPLAVKKAAMQLAIIADTMELSPVVAGSQVKSEKVDVIAVEYFENSNGGLPYFPMIDDLLKPYISSGLGINGVNFRTYRG